MNHCAILSAKVSNIICATMERRPATTPLGAFNRTFAEMTAKGGRYERLLIGAMRRA